MIDQPYDNHDKIADTSGINQKEYIEMETRLLEKWVGQDMDNIRHQNLLIGVWAAIFRQVREICHVSGLKEVERTICESYGDVRSNLETLLKIHWDDLKSMDSALAVKLQECCRSIRSEIEENNGEVRLVVGLSEASHRNVAVIQFKISAV